MRKNIYFVSVIVLALSLAILPTFANAETEKLEYYVSDAAGLLSEGQQQILENNARAISAQHDFGIYIITIDNYHDFGFDNAEECAEGFFLHYNLGLGDEKNGCLLLMSMDGRDYSLKAHGRFINTFFSNEKLNQMADGFIGYFSQNNWFGGFQNYISTAEQFLSQDSSTEARWNGEAGADTVDGYDATEIPEAVLEARSGIVHVYLLFYDEQGRLIALNSGSGLVTPGAVFRDEAYPERWNCVLTSFSCVDISRMTSSYASYQIVVLADGNVYRVKDVGGLPEINKELAFLFMEDYIPERNFIGLTQTRLIKEGETVYALGFPESSDQYAPKYESYVDEEIIRIGKILDMNHIESGVTYVQSNNGTQRNLIGGALVNSDGYLVGMISCYGGMEETLTITCDDIADLLKTANMPLAYGNIEGLEFEK